ncbi:MAG: hypothetical protein QMD86_02765 [Patescibacteria group bacterium]|nr:hypothetical protein [Patescibacteria group bacterium]
MNSYEKIAKILRTDKDNIRILEEKLSVLTGADVLEKILEENEVMMKNRLDKLGLARESSAKDIYNALISKIEEDDQNLYFALGKPQVTNPEDWKRVLKIAGELAGNPKGFFIKKEKIVDFLRNQPPQKVISAFNYKDVEELIEKEDIFEIFCSLRFIEGGDWLNTVFFEQYKNLKPEDFEEREIKTIALGEKWGKLAREFIRKKYHNISHLKELGVIYILPLPLEIKGETLRNFSLILHYFNEIPFYSSLIKKFMSGENNFARNLISLLRGDVADSRVLSSNRNRAQCLVVQRYLTKDDENDWRLFEPHINPEALHWERAERMLENFSDSGKFGGAVDLSFWRDLNWVGDYFKTETGIDVLVSFNLVDTVMSLVQKKEMVKYLYHQQEALWNKIFSEYLGEEKMEELMKENILRGWFEI